jgi:hypothetical protein
MKKEELALYRAYSFLPRPVAKLEPRHPQSTQTAEIQHLGIVPQPVAQLDHDHSSIQIGARPAPQLPSPGGMVQQPVAKLSIIQKINHLPSRLWHSRQALTQ